jgi:hypothetical protein
LALRETITIRPFQQGDEAAILTAFNRALESERTPRTLEHWRWLYEGNPNGMRVMLGLDEGGDVVAQCAGVPLRARVDGKSVLFCLALDGLNVRSLRTGHTRRGLFTACSEAFRENFGGEGEGRHVFTYASVGTHNAHVGRAPLGLSFLREGFRHVLANLTERGGDFRAEVRAVERFGPEVNEIFERTAVEARVLLVRDALFLNWRFVERPAKPYSCAIAWTGTRPAGIAVWRLGTFEGRPAGYACEWLVPRDEPHAASALLDWLVDKTRAAGAERLVAEFSPFEREWHEFQARGFHVVRARHHWSGASHAHAHHQRFFAHHFRAGLADGDWT